MGCADSGPSSPGEPASPPAAGAPWFEEVAAQAGVHFVHHSGHEPERFLIPEVIAGGVALLDADGDGLLDLYLVQAGSLTAPPEARPGNELYRNLGGFRFEDVSAASGADDRGYGIGVATGDFDADGRTDLYVTNVGPNVLLRNLGAATFRDVTRDAGVGHPGFGSSAAFFDFDRDGDLDLFVVNYLVWSVATEKECYGSLGGRDYCAPGNYNAPSADVLYRNEGDGRFVDVSSEAGLSKALGTGLGVACGDFTGDGWCDVFVANDALPNRLWVGSAEGRFEDRALLLGCAMDQDGVPKAGMGVAVADLEGDGDLDLLVGNLRRESDSLFLNQDGSFTDVTRLRGLGTGSRAFTRFGTGWVDLDDDGWLDLFEANGRVSFEENLHGTTDLLAEPNLLYRGLPEGGFEEVLPRGGCEPPLVRTSRGVAFGDLDDDGRIDLVVANRDGPPDLLRNVVQNDTHDGAHGHWLLVRVLEAHGEDALGARVGLRVGERVLRREVRTAFGYCSASDPRVHFGLGGWRGPAELEVRWVDGTLEGFSTDAIDRVIEVRRGSGRPLPEGR